MGAILSLSYLWYRKSRLRGACSEDNGRGFLNPSTTFYRNDSGLIPGLPNELFIQILARIPRIHYLRLKLVSRAWRGAVSTPEVYRLRRELGTSEEWIYILTKVGQDKLLWYGLDPLSKKWQRLPLMPMVSFGDKAMKGLGGGLPLLNVVGSALWVAELLRGSSNSDDVSKQTGVCGCAVGGVDSSLYVLGGFSKASTLRCVWRYDLATNRWSQVAPMSTGRAYCKTGILNNKLYVVGGVTRGSSGLVPRPTCRTPSPGSLLRLPTLPVGTVPGQESGMIHGGSSPPRTPGRQNS
ncbi:hypothetical protein MLD38_013468 [Melastoma candidum]|uniref:Uncharacterized protein n=1 Tax=Melastoma candidum TaxID=119954 RepID=A0ACB9RDV1_9MYRT|nr:hypothetical protein MLD38_013468 [Melastoma candidum]